MSALVTLVLCALAVPATVRGDERRERLSDTHRRWLDEEVVYIITEKETDVFLSLETEEQRRRFIEAFWKKRDPYPATIENEREIEHYRRLEYVNAHFSRDSPWPGFKTDRGRFYILLGEPASIERFEGLNQVVSTEIWFYNGDPQIGLPPRFNLLFFRENDLSPYRLYHPVADGPRRLLGPTSTFVQTEQDALRILSGVSIDLALAAITVDLTDASASTLLRPEPSDAGGFYRPSSMSSDATLANIANSPKKRIDNRDLEGFLRYGDRVSADYSFRFVPNRFLATVLPGPDDTSFVHYVVEIDPEHLSVEGDGKGRYRTTLDIDVELRAPKDRVIALHNTVPIELSEVQLRQAGRLPFAYEDDFPVAVPGTYRFSVTWKNRFSRQFTVAETTVDIPPVEGPAVLAGLVAAYETERVEEAAPDSYLPFQIGSQRWAPALEGVYAVGDTVFALASVLRATEGSRVRFSIRDATEAPVAVELADVGPSGLAEAALSLRGIAPGNFVLEAELLDADARVLNVSPVRRRPLTVSPRSRIVRAGIVYRQGFYTESPGLLSLSRGEQFLVMGRLHDAIRELEEAVAAGNPRLPMARFELGNALARAGQSERAIELLAPLEASHPDAYDVIEGLGLAHYARRDYEDAIRYLERARRLRTADAALLNALGAAYRALGRLDEARSAFEQSLELDPEQADVQEWLRAIG